jgi:hypothetical protein
LNWPVNNDRNKLLKRYEDMHEFSRHIIHFSEVLNVACNTLMRMAEDQERLRRENLGISASSASESDNEKEDDGLETGLQKSLIQITNHIQYHATFLNSLRYRSQSFDERLRNEIKLVGFL